MVGEINNGDGRVLPHSWGRRGGEEERGRASECGHKATERLDHSGEGEAAGGTMRWLRVLVEECALGSTMHGWEERVRGRRSARGLGDVLVVSSC